MWNRNSESFVKHFDTFMFDSSTKKSKYTKEQMQNMLPLRHMAFNEYVPALAAAHVCCKSFYMGKRQLTPHFKLTKEVDAKGTINIKVNPGPNMLVQESETYYGNVVKNFVGYMALDHKREDEESLLAYTLFLA